MRKRLFLAITFCFLPWVHPLLLFSADTAEALYQNALVAETGERDLDKAAALFKQAATQAKDDRALTGRALLHLGVCYERLGKVKEALLVYQSVVEMRSGVPGEVSQEARGNRLRLESRMASLLNPVETKKVTAGGTQSAAVQGDGSILWWGENAVFGKTLRPTPLEGFVNAVAMAWGSSHLVALNQDGTLSAGGENGHGQLGDETTLPHYQPVTVHGLEGVIAVAAGDAHSLAVKNDGTVWSWGSNNHGQLGDTTFTDRALPVQVSRLTDVIAVAGGRDHSVALKGNGSVWCWGYNNLGQLGLGSVFFVLPYPKQVPTLTSMVAVAAGENHSIVLRNDGTVWTWGDNSAGQLGNGAVGRSDTPLLVQGLGTVQAVAAGPTYTLVLKTDGTVWAWGDNTDGALGTGDTVARASPVQVAVLTNVQTISAGAWHNVAMKKDGTVWAWGRNDQGQIGDGTRQNRLTPVRISGAPPPVSGATP